MKTKYLMTLGAAALVATTTVAVAGGKYCDEERGGHYKKEHHGEYGMKGERKLDRMADYLELSDEQRTEINAIFADRADKMKAHRETMGDFYQQMRELSPSDPDYVASVKKLADSQAAFMADRMVERAEVKAQIAAVLTPEQQEKFDQMRNHHGKKGDRDHGYGDKHHS